MELTPYLTDTYGLHSFDITNYLHYGGLPGVYHFQKKGDRDRYLKTYGLMYLKEEVWNEYLVRKLNPFRSFLELASLKFF